jgi:hypothetical protein
MTVTVSLEFASPAEAVAALQALTGLSPQPEPAAPAKSTKTRAKAATDSAPPAATPAAPAAQAPAAVTPPAQSPAAPTSSVSIDTLNAEVKKLASKLPDGRDRAIKILGNHKVERTPQLKPEQYQTVFDDMQEENAKMDAASTQTSLV